MHTTLLADYEPIISDAMITSSFPLHQYQLSASMVHVSDFLINVLLYLVLVTSLIRLAAFVGNEPDINATLKRLNLLVMKGCIIEQCWYVTFETR